MTSFVKSLPCQKKTNIQAPRVLRLLEEKYIFVKKKTRSEIPLLTTTPFPRRRTTRVADASNIPGTTYCPWVWEQDNDPERVPRILVKAKCPGCKHFCKPVHYHHTVLIAKCDKTTGHKVWKWRERKLAVAYVYEPYDWREFLVAVWIVLLPKLLDYCNFIWKIYFYGIFIIYFEKTSKKAEAKPKCKLIPQKPRKIIWDVVSTSLQEGHAVFLTTEPLPHLLFLNKCFKYNFIIYVEQSKLTWI